MKKRVGILTSGGDCPGLNATIRGVAKALYARMGEDVEIVGILNGYSGLINGDYKEMCEDDFRGILTLGGTILGTKRTPFKMMRVVENDNIDKVAAMKKTYKEAKLDCLLCLGGNGTHKTANLLSQEGLNIIGLPKTIDNDIYGTDVTFGFHTAVDIATDVIDRIHTTAGSHSRVMCIEIMGNKAGWLTLYSGIAGGADIILLPEMPYDIDRVCSAVERRARKGSNFSIIAVAEGAINTEEAGMKRKEWMAKRTEAGYGATATNRIAAAVQKKTGIMLLNPILLTIAILIVFLKMTHISYETYNEGGHLIEFWLKPAVVALGVPLYLQLETIKKQLLPIMLSQLAGCIVGVISVVLIAKLMGASDEIIYSLAPKSVTTPIAMEVTKSLGGIPSLTAAVVVCVGLLGGILGFKTMKLTHIGSPMAQGLSLGAAAHAVGTSTAMDISRKYGAFASLGLTLNGIFTALLTPTILRLLGLL